MFVWGKGCWLGKTGEGRDGRGMGNGVVGWLQWLRGVITSCALYFVIFQSWHILAYCFSVTDSIYEECHSEIPRCVYDEEDGSGICRVQAYMPGILMITQSV